MQGLVVIVFLESISGQMAKMQDKALSQLDVKLTSITGAFSMLPILVVTQP